LEFVWADDETSLSSFLKVQTLTHRSFDMLGNAKLIDPWTQTIGLLNTSSHRMNAAEGTARLRQSVRCVEGRFGALVTLIDRQTASTATIAWRDPTRDWLADQICRKARARRVSAL